MSSYESDMTMVSIPRQAGPTPSAILYGKELEERFEVALLELKDNQRELIILRQLCGMSFDEIAEATGSKEGTVRKTIARALEKLEQLMQV
jgi:RNA polymerase sigma-70 factor (ECF subfamily)